jgi:DNA-binding response OmpR family regulator
MSAVETPVLSPRKPILSEMWMVPKTAEPKSRLLSISSNPEDHKGLSRIIDRKSWQLVVASTCRRGIQRLEKGVDAVFAECSLPDGTWKDILDRIAFLDKQPPLVVTSRLADAYLWSEVLNLGGFDVLAKPLNSAEVLQVLAAISRYRVRGGTRVRTAGTGTF